MTRLHCAVAAALSCAVLLLTSGVAAAAGSCCKFKNGNFETPLVPIASFVVYAKGDKIGRWKVVGADGNVFLVHKDYTIGPAAFPAKKGIQWLCATGSSRTETGVEQTLVTTPSQKYVVKFAIGNINNPGAGLGSKSTIKIYVDGVLLDEKTNTQGGATQFVWKTFSVTFTAASTSTTLRLLNGDDSTDGINGLDAISVNPAP